MGFPTKVQLIDRQGSQQWYVNLPAALARACEFLRGEIVEWIVKDDRTLILRRNQDPASTTEIARVKKKR
jgi:antitoxin component of MazEF toxin-antitoxin module